MVRPVYLFWHWLYATSTGGAVFAHEQQHVMYEEMDSKADLFRKWSAETGFQGISTFAHLPHVKCLLEPEASFDIAIVGVPFDTSVTFRSGARFGPRAIREASARQNRFQGFNPRGNLNPYMAGADIIDCGDILISPFNNTLAMEMMTEGFELLSARKSTSETGGQPHYAQTASPDAPKYRSRSKLVSLGGDHSIILPALRALRKKYDQPITVLHFDAHLDTWRPDKFLAAGWQTPDTLDPAFFTHGSMFHNAWREGLLATDSCTHAGLRTRLTGAQDLDDDSSQGWLRIAADDIDDIGARGIVEKILRRIGTERPVYLSVDIDVLDPGLAPGTGTPEAGGWTSRELIRILRWLETLNVVGADVVEVSPPYDGAGGETALAAQQVAYEIITSMVKRGLSASDV